MTELRKLEEEYIKKCWIEVVGVDNYPHLHMDTDGFVSESYKRYAPEWRNHDMEQKSVVQFVDAHGKRWYHMVYRPIGLVHLGYNSGWTISADDVIEPTSTGLYHVEIDESMILLHYESNDKTWYRVSLHTREKMEKYAMKWKRSIKAWKPYVEVARRLY